jgi:Fur family transcriptional regulator, ferric uptake regulator
MRPNPHNFQRSTRQRQVILEELCKTTAHPTAVALYEVVRQRLPKISLGTVYRNLDLLVQMGQAQRFEAASGEARFDGNPARHNHVRCVRCGRIDDLMPSPLDLPAAPPKDTAGYQILGHRLEYLGVCPQCREAGPKPESESPS